MAGNFQQAKRGERDGDKLGPGLLIQDEDQVTCMLVEKKLQSYACVVLHFACLFCLKTLKWFVKEFTWSFGRTVIFCQKFALLKDCIQLHLYYHKCTRPA